MNVTQTVMYPATQEFPHPHALQKLVDNLSYKPGWSFELRHEARGQGCAGLTLNILVYVPDSYKPECMTSVMHYMPVPPAAYDERSWLRWLLDQILLVEQHEACEFFKINGKRPFSPNHGPGRNPYSILEKGSAKDAATFFTGEVNPKFTGETA